MNTKDKFIFIILFSIIGFGFYFQHLNDENLKKMDSLKDDNKDFENIGVTVHFVDEGIDTGSIISKTHVNFENENNISKAYRELLRLSSKVLADTTLEITKNRNINTISNEDGNYYSKIPIKKYLKAKKHFKHIGEK